MNYSSVMQSHSLRTASRASDAQLGSAGEAQSERAHRTRELPSLSHGLWQGPRDTYSSRSHPAEDDASPRRGGWIPPRCLMVVLFVIGVSVCVSSGFALFVEYQNSCPQHEDVPDESAIQQQSAEAVGHNAQGIVFASEDISGTPSRPCDDTEIAGTLLIKYLFFLLGLCIALCTLACAVIFLTHSTPDGHHSRFCFCFPTSQAYANRIRAFVGLEPLPEDPAGIRQLSRHMRDADTILTSARRGSSRESFRDIYGRQLGNSSARSEHLWSPREVPVLHGVLVLQPHMRNGSSFDSTENFGKSPNGAVVGVPDSVLTTFGWSPRSQFKKHFFSPLAPGRQLPGNDQGPSDDPTADLSSRSSTGVVQQVVGSSNACAQSQHAQHGTHASEELSQSAVAGRMHDAVSAAPAQLQPEKHMHSPGSSSEEFEDAMSGSAVPYEQAPEAEPMWEHHHNSITTNSCSGSVEGGRAGPNPVAPPACVYPDFSSTLSARISRLDGASTGPQPVATAHSSSRPECLPSPASGALCENAVGAVAASTASAQPPAHAAAGLEPEQSIIEASTEASDVPSTVSHPSLCGLASENTMHDLGADLSLEASVGFLAPEAALGDVTVDVSTPELGLEGSAESAGRVYNVAVPPLRFEFAKGRESDLPTTESTTPRMKLASGEQQASKTAAVVGGRSDVHLVVEGAGSSIPEDSMQQNNMAVHRPTALRVPGRSTQSTSQQAGAGDRGSSSPESSLLVGAVDSVLTAESSLAESSALPEGMSSDSALSACPSGLSAGYSLQSIIGGAVTRFAE